MITYQLKRKKNIQKLIRQVELVCCVFDKNFDLTAYPSISK